MPSKEIFVYAYRPYEGAKEYDTSLSEHPNMEEHGWILLDSQQVYFTMPAVKELEQKEVAALQKKLQKLRATFQMEVDKLMEQITKLQALEYVPAESVNPQKVVEAADIENVEPQDDDLPF